MKNKDDAINAKKLGEYFAEVNVQTLLERATAALCRARPVDPKKFLAKHFMDQVDHLGSINSEITGNPLAHYEMLSRQNIQGRALGALSAIRNCYRETMPVTDTTLLNFAELASTENRTWDMSRKFSTERKTTIVRSPCEEVPHTSPELGGTQDPVFNTTQDSSHLLADKDIEAFHVTLRALTRISSMHEAIKLSPNLRWDHTLQRCLPGRIWGDTTPPSVREKLSVGYTASEKENIEHVCRLHAAPSVKGSPRVLYILGPAGAGKSCILEQAQSLLDIAIADFVEVEGDVLRDCYGAWQQELQFNSHIGYKDSMSIISVHVDKVKSELITKAVDMRKNLLISKTGQNLKDFQREVQDFRELGYIIDVIGLVVSKSEAGTRARNRAHENGRWHEPSFKKWLNVMSSIRFLMHDGRSDNCIVFDNQDFNNPTPIYVRTHCESYVEGIMKRYLISDGGHEEMLYKF